MRFDMIITSARYFCVVVRMCGGKIYCMVVVNQVNPKRGLRRVECMCGK